MANPDLGKALAPDSSTFDEVIVDGTPDPLTVDSLSTDLGEPELEITEELPGAESFAPEAITDPMAVDPIEIVDEPMPTSDPLSTDSTLDVPSSLSGDDTPLGQLLDQQTYNDEAATTSEDPMGWDLTGGEAPSEVGEALVTSILDTARAFKCEASDSQNSVRRALAVCDRLEKMIVAGVTADSERQLLTLAELKLLDTVEQGLHLTRAALNKPMERTARAGTGGGSFYYDPFCATIARILINGQVANGKKVQDLFGVLQKKFNIDKREEVMISQIMKDMGYSVRSLIDGEDMIEQFYS